MSNKNKNNIKEVKEEVKVPNEPLNAPTIPEEDKKDLKELQEVSDKVEEIKREETKKTITEEDKEIINKMANYVSEETKKVSFDDVEARIKIIKDKIALREETLKKCFGAEQQALIGEEIRILRQELKEITASNKKPTNNTTKSNKLIGSELSVKDRRPEYQKSETVSLSLTRN